MPKKHRLSIESRTIFAALLAVLFLAGCQTVPPEPLRASTAAQISGRYCGDRDALVEGLWLEYAEWPKSMGLANNGFVLETLAAESGTWTILVTAPQGVTYAIWFGEHWQDVLLPAEGRPL